MNFTQEEKQIAKQMLKNKEFVALLEKVFTPDTELLEPSLEKMALSLDDAHYGQNMKAFAIAKAMFGTKMNSLKAIAGKEGEKHAPAAPR